MTRYFKIVWCIAGSMLLGACKEAYDTPVIDSHNQYLVVEGMLNQGGITNIKLSRSRSLNNDFETPELKAAVNVESESNQKFSLTDNGNGEYTGKLSIKSTEKYRLRIKTSAGKEYISDYVPVLNTPDIDRLTWKKTDEGLHIFVDSHDPANKTKFYRWGYEETWIVDSKYLSVLEYADGIIRPRTIPAHRTCYNTNNAEPLVLASTVKLNADVVSNVRVNLVSTGSPKLANKYSILVKQYALTDKAYEYWDAMRKNTEQLGSIFDPQPSYMYGNIRAVDKPKELVVGYFGACNVTEKRIFLTGLDLQWYIAPPNPDPCSLIVVSDLSAANIARVFGTGKGQLGWTVVDKVQTGLAAVAESYCADCGPNYIRPAWWQ